jgi:predicted PilT family ATPase
VIDTKSIGVDVHKESISIAVRNSVSEVVRECVIETKASGTFGGEATAGTRPLEEIDVAFLGDILDKGTAKINGFDARRRVSLHLEKGGQPP